MAAMDYITQYIKSIIVLIDWRTFLDVPIIALGIFFLYHTLRTSGVWRIALGVSAALFIYVLANVLNLTGIEWIYSNFSNIALIAIIVIFQPEIRKIFENAASSLRVKWIGKHGKRLSVLISNAAFSLVDKKWGAIIVLPGMDFISSKVSGGIELNAIPSLALISSIFDPHSSGHDGAIIIENGLVKEFALRLPLSSSGKLGSDFGTRHHAAMGLSENSDALVIVVSEERGNVSIFNNGKHISLNEKKDLSTYVESHWEKTGSYSPEGKNFKKQGIFLIEITVSLLAAFLLWSSIMFSATHIKQMAFTIPIEYKIGTSDNAISGEKPTAVRIKVSGNAADLNLIKPNELKVAIDFSSSKPGKRIITVTKSNITLPAGVHLIDAEPSVFEIDLQSFTEKKVAVKPQIIGALPEGLEIYSIEVVPNEINILYSTNEKGLEDIYITTTPIFLKNISEDTRLICNLIAPPNIYPVGKHLPDVEVVIILKPKKAIE